MVWASSAENERMIGPKRMLGIIGPGESKYTEYDQAVVTRTQNWIADRANDDRSWCLYVGLVAPHFPLVVPQEYFDMYPPEMLPEVKLHPNDGYQRHPWIEKQNAFMDSENQFADAGERLAAMSAYYGLCSWLDHNVGQIVEALETSGQIETTQIIYTSDHGDNVGARGLWGKSNMYEESAAVPLIMAGPDIPHGVCDTPVSLLMYLRRSRPISAQKLQPLTVCATLDQFYQNLFKRTPLCFLNITRLALYLALSWCERAHGS